MTNFKDQFQQLLLSQPRYNLKQVAVENCDYADTAVKSGNCYYTFGAFYCEDIFYGRYSRKCRDCVDISFCLNCEGCYSCVDCVNCYMTSYSKNCQNCTDVKYCFDCFSCENCFGCVGLYQKKYCIFNTQYSEADYFNKLAEVILSDSTQQVETLKQTVPLLNVHQFKSENSIGENLSECGNCFQCYDSFALENCLYCIETNGNKDCCDLTVCFEAEACYSAVQSPLNYNCNFLFQTDQSQDSEFCAYSKNLENCFGCVYLANKEYYILNKPYSPKAYHETVTAIKQELILNHEYNMLMYFASDYEQQRLVTETDSIIKII